MNGIFLEGDYIYLRPPVAEDVKFFYKWNNDFITCGKNENSDYFRCTWNYAGRIFFDEN